MPEPGFPEQPQRREKSSPPATELLPDPTDRQKQILSALGSIDDLSQRLFGHLKDNYGQKNPDRQKKLVAGELAEILVMAEFGIFPVTLNGEELVSVPAASDKTISEFLLGALRIPAMFGLGEGGRNPDIAFIDAKGGIIRAAGDVKIGKMLDPRALKQLKRSGFRRSINILINNLNQRDDLRRKIFGSDDGGNVIRGRVAEGFFQIVFLPSDTDTTPDKWDNLLIPIEALPEKQKQKGLTQEEINSYKQLLSQGHVKLVNFSFSRQEIGEMTKKLMAEITQMMGQEKVALSALEKKHHPESVQLPGDKA